MTETDAYHELSAYTLGHGNVAFIHLRLAFSLAGLYLKIEKQFTGRQVQNAHRQLAERKQPWPAFVIPSDRGRVTTIDVMSAAEGDERDRAIDAWCESVWNAFASNRALVVDLLKRNQVSFEPTS